MHKNATKCNEKIAKWCKNKHGASKTIDTFETYHSSSKVAATAKQQHQQSSSKAPASAKQQQQQNIFSFSLSSEHKRLFFFISHVGSKFNSLHCRLYFSISRR
jgi:hypothetical protein